MSDIKPGDRLEGLYRHKGRKATVHEVGRTTLLVKFDDGKRKVWVERLLFKKEG